MSDSDLLPDRREDVFRPRVIIADLRGVDVLALHEAIVQAGMSATIASSRLQLRRRLYRQRYNLLVVDAVLSSEDAICFCGQVRSTETVPILLLLPPNRPDLVVSALSVGADDCMPAPVSLPEFIARIKSLLRRSGYANALLQQVTEIGFSGFRLNPGERVLRGPDGQIINLTAAEFDLMLTFCRNPGRLMRRDELLASTYVGVAGPVARSIDVHISRLRRKIEIDPQRPKLLKTVRLGGYLLTAKVTTR
ncbi:MULTISPECIES: response regulator transcription factor [unclassified Rhizobium]|uniref:response regulator transcription factor n=1 Tax=unclassified Rhizobium TaxID=2613769 RepID=UPI0009F45CDD|nr:MULTISPECIES: response regulator transcription factor [unclassified Rhizobium]MDM9621893.1 response regulator transcription factor [Rhizobium sp. S96]